MTTSWLVCHALLEKSNPGQTKAFSSFLPHSLQNEFLTISSSHEDLTLGFDQESYLLEHVHVSWFARLLRTLSKQKISLFLPLFPDSLRLQLQEMLLFRESFPPLTTLAKSYLRKELVSELLKSYGDLPPVEALPPSAFFDLLSLSAEELHTLVDFLGLRDLAAEITQIIDKTKLNQIYAILSQDKKSYLTCLMQKKEPLAFKKMDLSKGAIEKDTFLALLHKRGMNRLAKALYGQNPHFIWYIKHQMPEEEALLFTSLHKPLTAQKAQEVLMQQVIELAHCLLKSSSQVAS